MSELLQRLFLKCDFMPHGHCYFWTPSLVWLHALADSVIGLAYLVIPILLWRILRRRSDIPYNHVVWCFAIFIIACGGTHWMEVWTLWHGAYWVSGGVKIVTALASLGTAFLLWRHTPAILAIPTRDALESALTALRESEEKLRTLNTELEERVAQRTADLERAYGERRRLQEQLLQSQKMEAVGRLAGGIAHDFNNMLTVITGYVDVLIDRLDTAKQLECAFAIKSAAERAAKFTQQLLAFSRKQILQPVVHCLDETIEQFKSMMRRLIGEKVEYVVELSPERAAVYADPIQLQQILMNLTINARDAMPRGGRLTVRTDPVTVRDEEQSRYPGLKAGPYVRLSVIDTGVGMDEPTREKVFEPFFTTKPAGKGTGLGLAVVHGIVAQSGGYISVSSQAGVGSTFEVFLPRVSPAEPGPVVGTNGVAVRGPTGGETILLVEDEETVRKLIQSILEDSGYQVLVGDTSRDAEVIGANYKGPIHLVLTDVMMPGMLGPELVERLVHVRPGLRVLYMSGYTDGSLSRDGVLQPGVPLLAKPFGPEMLRQKVRDVLDDL